MRGILQTALMLGFILILAVNVFLKQSVAYDRGYSSGYRSAMDSVLVILKKTLHAPKRNTWDTVVIRGQKWKIQRK